MRFLRSLLVSLPLLASAFAVDFDSPDVPKEKHGYQSDVTRLRKIVINSLYSHRDVFLRELISNSNDAIEKLRLTALTDKSVYSGENPLNITIQALKDEEGDGGRIIITDTGIGMSPEELTNNLGTLAKSGTAEFLDKAESSDTTGNGNLIGAFGLGFYSSFLVADKVYVASLRPKSDANPNPQQYVFSSSADESSFETFPDPRGNTLGDHGTEITLILKSDAVEYLNTHRLTEMVIKHSSFATAYPIYLWTERTEEVPDEEVASEEVPAVSTEDSTASVTGLDVDDEEAVIEEVAEEATPEEPPVPKTKTVTVQEWIQTNPQQPIWMRDPKEIDEEEYKKFYQTTFTDFKDPLAWHHFSGDSGSGSAFKAILYIPGHLNENYWANPAASLHTDFRLLVKRVFITSDLGENLLPKWASWVKVIVDAEDLPLNVSRETLQSTAFLKQMKSAVVRRLIQLLERISKEDPEKFRQILEVYGPAIKLGAIDDSKNSKKLAGLARFHTNQRNETSFDQYLENKKQGQKQIFFLADMGKTPEHLAQSVFIEKLAARGYEVLLLNQPLDEVVIQTLRGWKSLWFQDVAKAGLKFGDEETDPDYNKAATQERFKPLLDYLKTEAGDVVSSVVISDRLVTSPCAVVADKMGYTANVEKLMSAQNKKPIAELQDFARRQRILEINPKAPLIEGLLRRVEQLPTDEDERDLEDEDELKETIAILLDGALVRSGFDVADSNKFLTRVDRVLRRSLGVSETAETDATVKPAPPVEPASPEELAAEEFQLPEELSDAVRINVDDFIAPEAPAEEAPAVHDEL